MSKLYELTENYNNLLELLEDETIPQEIIEKSLSTVSEEIDVKAENIAKVIKSIEVDTKGLKEEEQRLAARRNSLENRLSNLKDYLYQSMKALDKQKIKGSLFTLGIQKNPPSVNISNIDSIPKDYFVAQEPLLDKKAILADLKTGKLVEGAEIKQTESLRIR